MPTDPYEELARSVLGAPKSSRLHSAAKRAGISTDIADDFAKVINFESGGSHYDRRGRVKLSPPDPKTGERAVGRVQIKPSTARPYGLDPFKEDDNLEAGLRYFHEGGSDPVGRRIHYFGGPGALKRFKKTGRIPKGGDVLGTSFQEYVQRTGAQARQPQSQKSDDDPYDQLVRRVLGTPELPDDEYTKLARRVLEPEAPPVPQRTGRFGTPAAPIKQQRGRRGPPEIVDAGEGYSQPSGLINRDLGLSTQPQRQQTPAELLLNTIGGREKRGEDIQNILEGVTGAVAGTGRQLANAQELGMRVTPVGIVGRELSKRVTGFDPQAIPSKIKDASQYLESVVAENEAARPAPTTFAGNVRRGVGKGVGAAVVEMPKLILGGRALGAVNLPVQGALARADEGVSGIVKGAAGGLVYHYGGALTGKAFSGVSPYLAKVGNSLVWIAGPVAEQQLVAKVTGSEPPNLARSIGENIPFGIMAGMGARGKVRVKTRRGERDATEADLPKILKKELEIVPPERVEDAPVPQRFQHLQFGEVEVTADQSGARRGRLRVAEVGNPDSIHYVKKADLRGRGNERMVPLRESTEVLPEVPAEKPQQPSETKGATGAPSSPRQGLTEPPENVQWMPDRSTGLPESGRMEGQAARTIGLEITENPYRRVDPKDVERFKPLAEEWEAGWKTQTGVEPETLRVEPTQRTYQEVQNAIDARETELESRGVNVTRLYDASDPANKVLPADWKPMPDDLASLYRERDAIGSGELTQSVNEISGRLRATGLSGAEVEAVLNEFSLGRGTSATSQYMAAEYTQQVAAKSPRELTEKVYMTLAGERGIDTRTIETVEDIGRYGETKTLEDAAKAVRAIQTYFRVEPLPEQSRLASTIEEKSRASEQGAQGTPVGADTARKPLLISSAREPVSLKPETTSVEQGVKTIKGDEAQPPRDVPVESRKVSEGAKKSAERLRGKPLFDALDAVKNDQPISNNVREQLLASGHLRVKDGKLQLSDEGYFSREDLRDYYETGVKLQQGVEPSIPAEGQKSFLGATPDEVTPTRRGSAKGESEPIPTPPATTRWQDSEQRTPELDKAANRAFQQAQKNVEHIRAERAKAKPTSTGFTRAQIAHDKQLLREQIKQEETVRLARSYSKLPEAIERPSSSKAASPTTQAVEKSLAPETKVSEQPIKEVINEATAPVTRPESTIVGEGAGPGGLERGTAPAPSKRRTKPHDTLVTGERSDISLSQFVRKRGGIVPGEMFAGELDRLRSPDTGTTGLVNQRNVRGGRKMTADYMMEAANEAGFKDPQTGEKFDNVGNFLYAVERDVSTKNIKALTGAEVDFETEYRKHVDAQMVEAKDRDNAIKSADALVSLLEGGRGGELFDKIAANNATPAEQAELRSLARKRFIRTAELEDVIAEAKAEGLSTSFEGERAANPGRTERAEQLGFVQEGLEQQSAPPPKQKTFEPIVVPDAEGYGHKLIHLTARGDTPKFQITRFDKEGTPVGHDGEPTLEGALKEAGYFREVISDAAKFHEPYMEARHALEGTPLGKYAYISPNRPFGMGWNPLGREGVVSYDVGRTKAVVFTEKPLPIERQEKFELKPVNSESVQAFISERTARDFPSAPPMAEAQRERLLREEQERQATANPERTAALKTLADLRSKGMTVDEYARQGSLIGETPSRRKLALLRELEGGNFGPGAASAKEPFPEVKERKFGKRFVEDERIAQEIRDSIGTAKYYEPIPNKVTVADAKKLVDERGVGQSINAIKDEGNNIPFHVRVAMGEIVALRANKAYKNLKESNPKEAEFILDQANETAEYLMDLGTRLGQGVQAYRMWSQQTPEGILLTYQKAVAKARQRHQAKVAGEEVKEIVDTVNKEMSHEERVKELKKLFTTNKTARKVRSQMDQLLKAAKDKKLEDKDFYDIVGDRLGLPKYDPKVASRIMSLAEQIADAPEGLPRDRKILQLNKYLAEQKGFEVGDLPIGIYYGNILSGYNTHIVNSVDTALNVISEINGLAMNNPRAAAKIYGGLLRGFSEGKLDAILTLTEGRMVTDGKWLEVPRLMEIAEFGKKGGVPISTATRRGRAVKKIAESKAGYPLNAYKYVTRMLAASDAVMFRSAKEARAALLAHRMAEAEGLTGDALDAKVRSILALDRKADFEKQAEREGFTGTAAKVRTAELIDMARNKEISSDAADFAGEATYNHKPHGALGYASDVVGKWAERYKALKLFVPFTRIVANVTNRGLNWTPYGFKRAAFGYSHGEALTPEGRRLMITRATLGTVGLVTLGAMQEAGLLQIHGAGPSDREKKRQLQNAGWRPYSIQIGSTYVSYVYSPTGLGLSIVGNMSDSQRYHELEQKDAATRGAYAIARLGSTVFSQSFLSGLSRLFNALSESPSESVSAVKQTMSSTVAAATTPNLARDIYRLFDNKAYQSNTLMEDLVRNTPFAALALKPQLNAFGEPVRVQRQRFFDVQTSDPAWQFVIQKGLKVPVPGRTLEIGKDERITPEQYYELLATTGPRVKQWVIANRTRLSRMKEDDAQDELQQAATRIRKFELSRMRLLARRKKAA